MTDQKINHKENDLLCIGTALVDSIIRGFDPTPVSASGYRADSGALFAGGESVNVSMAAAKLGLKTAILAALGTDAAGDLVCSALIEAGVDTGRLIRGDDHPTPVTTLLVNADGTRKSITNRAHRYNFHPERYTDCLKTTRMIALGSLFRAPFDDPAVIDRLLHAAKEAGCLVLADTKLPNFTRLSLEDLKDLLPLIDYIFPNEDEAAYYTGQTDPEAMADVFLSYGIPRVIIKLGAKGCLFKSQTEHIRLDAFPIDPVDATGAGDNFLAGFAAQLAGSLPVPEDHRAALSFANACGALCTMSAGAAAGLKSAAQVRAFMNESR